MKLARDRGTVSMAGQSGQTASACFFERDAGISISRRAAVEGIGTLLLMLAIVGSGQISGRFADPPSAIGNIIAAIATAGALVGIIVAFGSVSGGHFNPLITLLQWLRGERAAGCTAAYVVAQICGATFGAALASRVFAVVSSGGTPAWPTATLFASEVLSSAGLMLVVFGCSHSGRRETGPFAVGAWLAAAILAMPSLSYANPAVTLGALFASGPVALSNWTSANYLAAELLGGLIALPILIAVFPSVNTLGQTPMEPKA